MRQMSVATRVYLVAVLMAAPVATVVAQRGTQAPPTDLPPLLVRAAGETPVPGKCLFKEDLDLIAARRALTRTTLNNDAEAPFDPEYLVGRWTFEYDVPDSALGPAGQISGTETVQHVDGCLYEGATQAKGPAGAFTIKSTILYDPSWSATVAGSKCSSREALAEIRAGTTPITGRQHRSLSNERRSD
jgi:hypothetical protein